jgi:glycosyltransferase involved in cell wall biosynthesis
MSRQESSLVSVIVPSYNGGRYLPEAIDSVLRQTYKRVELIVVDDGSTDDTAAVAARYPEVRYFRQENQGVAAARNRGVRESRGGLLVFLDSDDVLLPTALEIGAKNLQARPECAFVSGQCDLVTTDGKLIPMPQSLQYASGDHYLAMLRRNYIWNPGAVMHRRAAFEAVGGFSTTFFPCEDYEFYLRVTPRYPVHCHGKTVLKYRQTDDSISRQTGKMLRGVLEVLGSQRELVRGRPEHEAALRQGITHFKVGYGSKLAEELARCVWRPRLWGLGARNALLLARYHPAGLITFLLFLLPWLGVATGGDAENRLGRGAANQS